MFGETRGSHGNESEGDFYVLDTERRFRGTYCVNHYLLGGGSDLF